MDRNRPTTLHRVLTSKDEMKFDENAALGILQHLDKDSLQQLSDSEEKLKEYASDLVNVKGLAQDKEMMIASNKSLAEYNKSMQPKVSQGRELLALEYERAAKYKEEYDSLLSQIASTSQTQSLDLAHMLLQTKAAESEEETDRLSEMFLDKQIECDEFLDQYIEKRTQTHLLKIKSEKLGEMMLNHTTTATWSGPASPTSQHPQLGNFGRHTQTATAAHPPYPMYSTTSMPTPVMPPVSS